MLKTKSESIFNWIILILLLILLIGNPLLFTSMTRSVFEVNKLLCLRLTSMLVAVVWLFKYLLYKRNGNDNAVEESYSVFGLRWKKIGLEIPMLIWLGFNLISTVFSTNVIISIIGAYDRWEGIFTVVNYSFLWFMFAKLVTEKFQLNYMLIAIVFSTFFSSIYGIFQSLGLDFMNWSVNASARVFACINNPVHFCAFVGMVIPLAIGWLLFISEKGYSQLDAKTTKYLKASLFIVISVIFYAQLLSFSRATWLGFCASMTYFYLLISGSLITKTKKYFTLDFFINLAVVAVFYLAFIFKMYLKGPLFSIPLLLLIAGYCIYSFYALIPQKKLSTILVAAVSIIILALCYVADLRELFGLTGILISIALALYFLRICTKADDDLKVFLSRFVIIILFAILQFVAISVVSLLLYMLLCVSFYILEFRKSGETATEKNKWLVAFIIAFGFIVSIPTIHQFIGSLTTQEKDILAIKNAQNKLQTYGRDALKGTARTSMWKSSIPWIKDYWLIGSGLDTIKYKYPDYRRPEYGILEGGHNFTPDRLHNEYLNTLATKGIPATVTYYVFLMGGWYLLILRHFFEKKNNPYSYILVGCLTSAGVYLGQVFFNFGVVATLVLFYVCVGIGQALVTQPSFNEEASHE